MPRAIGKLSVVLSWCGLALAAQTTSFQVGVTKSYELSEPEMGVRVGRRPDRIGRPMAARSVTFGLVVRH